MNTLFDKIGGRNTVERLVDLLYEKIMNDPEMKNFFNKTDIQRLKMKKRMFLMMILGGPVRYSSKDIATAHSPAVQNGLTTHHFKKYISLLEEVLSDSEIDPINSRLIIEAAEKFEKQVLSGEKHPPMKREIEVSSLDEFIDAVSQFNENTLYRGQGSKNWELLPTLARLELSNNPKLMEHCNSWSKLEKEIINRFKRHSQPHLTYIPETYIEWLTLAQHHGLPTRLLDWSQNPLVSLYFALSSSSKDESMVVAMDPKFIYNIDIDLTELDQLQVYFPKNIDPKLVSQKGCFTIQPLPKDNDPFIPLDADMSVLNLCSHSFSKIIIPANTEIKKSMLNQLANNGIDEMFIFPDLYGLSRQIKKDIQSGIIRF